MAVRIPAGGGSGWTVAEPPSWCRDDILVLLELVPERPAWLANGPPRELEEALGIELWRAVANVRLWAETAPALRNNLFARIRSVGSPSSGTLDALARRREDARILEPNLAPALEVFSGLTNAPEATTVSEVVSACETVVTWAEQRGFSETAVQFAEATAAAVPESPAIANLAGRLCRIYGKRGRAELWYDRAIGLSRRTPGKAGIREYIHAHLGFATTLLEIEDHGRALKYIKRAGLMAKRKGMRAKAAEAFHDAMYLSTVVGALNKATIYARRAISLYPYHHHRLPAMAHDFALLLVYKGMYAPALSILCSAVRKLPQRSEAIVAWGTIARAAAGAGRVTVFREAVCTVDSLASSYGHFGAAAKFSVAEGARLLGAWDLAKDYASAALDGAAEANLQQVVTLATKLLGEVEREQRGIPNLAVGDATGTLLRRLAPVVRLRLARWRGSTWRVRRTLPE